MERVLDEESGGWFCSWSATICGPGPVTLHFLSSISFVLEPGCLDQVGGQIGVPFSASSGQWVMSA